VSALALFYTSEGIIAVTGKEAVDAAILRLKGSLASGEAAGVAADLTHAAAPVVSTWNDAVLMKELMAAAGRADWNEYAKESFAAVLGTLAGVAALPAGPTMSLASDMLVTKAYQEAHDAASNFSRSLDWTPVFDRIDAGIDHLNRLFGEMEYDAEGVGDRIRPVGSVHFADDAASQASNEAGIEHARQPRPDPFAPQGGFNTLAKDTTTALGPDGQPWGTPTRLAPNAATEWARSPQPGQWLHTTLLQSGDDTETRITKSIDRARWQVVSEQVHERAHGVERLVSTTDTLSGQGWTLDRASGQMQPFTLDEEAAAQARMAPAVQNHRALNNEQLQQCHRNEAEQMVQSMHSVYALATGHASSPGSHANTEEAHADPLPREQAIEAGMGTFRRATAELLSAREVMRERGMELPEVTDVPDLSRHRAQATAQMPNPQPQLPTLTEQQQRHHQMAQNQLGPLLREHGHSDEQIQRVSAAAMSHAQQFAHRGPVHSFLLNRDGSSVAVLQESAPMSEFSVQAAQRQSPEQHLERAHALAHEQDQGRERAHTQAVQAHAAHEVGAPTMTRG
jgi:hypothetical protein